MADDYRQLYQHMAKSSSSLLPEMTAEANPFRNERMPDSPLKGSANVLIMPNVEAARISYNLLRVSSSEGVTVGPVLMGVAKPVHVLTPIASVRRIVNMVALAVVEAQTQPL
jgi:malate dehydrogenase (oxaloacetate-decarboxylating)(NADP+)